MSNHNYTQYSNKNKNKNAAVEEVVTEVPVVEEVTEVAEVTEAAVPEIELVQETVDTVVVPETVTGTVVNCAKLNVRAEASVSGAVVCVLAGKSEIEIDVAKSTKDWFYVCTAAGVEGYCMKQFVDAHI